MPANNRVHSSAALQTHGIWQSAIGYDPYAPTAVKDTTSKSVPKSAESEDADGGGDGENAYASFQGLLALARITNNNTADDTRGACKKCGRVGHLTYQCRNFLSVKDEEGDDIAANQTAIAIFGKMKKGAGKIEENSEEDDDEDEEDSESSDSDADSEMDRIIAERFGKKKSAKPKKITDDEVRRNVSKKRKTKTKHEKKHRTKRGKTNHHRNRDESSEEGSEERGRHRRHLHRKRDESSDEDSEEDGRHRRHTSVHRHRRSSKKKPVSDGSESDVSSSESYLDRKRRRRQKSSRKKDHSETSDEESLHANRGKKMKKKHDRHRSRRVN